MLGFRVWDSHDKCFYIDPSDDGLYLSSDGDLIAISAIGNTIHSFEAEASYRFIPMQSTGVKDKTGLTEVYEGDIIDSNGFVIGNIYELHPRETDLVIQGFGKKIGHTALQKAMERGCMYSE